VGYYEAKIEDAVFVVRAEQQGPALERLLALSADDLGYDLSDRGLTSLDEFLRLFAVQTVREGDDIVGLTFEDRYLLELDDVFRALGPYVEPGSWVLFHSGTTDRWRYVFDGGVDRRTEPPKPWYGR
jgi:hypothetical protein